MFDRFDSRPEQFPGHKLYRPTSGVCHGRNGILVSKKSFDSDHLDLTYIVVLGNSELYKLFMDTSRSMLDHRS